MSTPRPNWSEWESREQPPQDPPLVKVGLLVGAVLFLAAVFALAIWGPR